MIADNERTDPKADSLLVVMLINIHLIHKIKGASTCRRRGEGMQLSYILYRGQNAKNLTSIMPY